MKAFIRIISVFLALVMLAAIFVGCDTTDDEIKETENVVATKKNEPDNEEDDESDAGGTNNRTPVTVPAATERPSYNSKFPEHMNWGGEEFLILGQNDRGNPSWENFEIARYEFPNDMVGKAVWERNEAIRQKYNLIIEQELVTSANKHIVMYYAAAEDRYDMVMYQLDEIFSHIQSGYLVDLTTLNYMDFDHPTWDASINDQFTFGTSTYAVSSDFNLQNKAQLSCLYYNRDMLAKGDENLFEDMVISGEWTLDNYNEIVRSYAKDADNNGKKGDYRKDIFGLCGDEWNFLAFSAGAGYRASRAVNGNFQMIGAGENVLGRLKKVGGIFFDKEISFITESISPLDYGRSSEIFLSGRSLFFASEVADINKGLSDTSFELGILPFPKYIEDQKAYCSQVNPKYASVCTVPMTVYDTDLSGFGLELLAEASTLTSYDAYINMQCKMMNSYDQKMAYMYEVIFSNPVYDLVVIGNFGTIGKIMMIYIPRENGKNIDTIYRDQIFNNAERDIKDIMSDLGIA